MKGLEHFESILKHYILLALREAGVNIDADTYAELRAAFEGLERVIREIVNNEISKRESGD